MRVLPLLIGLCLATQAMGGGVFQTPTHETTFAVTPLQTSQLLSKLDEVAAQFGYKAFDAGPDVSELVKRPAFFRAYMKAPRSDVAFDITNVKDPRKVYLRFYGDQSESAGRDGLKVAISRAIEAYGGELSPAAAPKKTPSVKSNRKE